MLRKLGIEAVSVSRSGNSAGGTEAFERPSIGYHELNAAMLRHHLLVVHCTPVGMSPATGERVDSTDLLTPNHLVMDLIYTLPKRRCCSSPRPKVKPRGMADMLRLQAGVGDRQEAGV